MNAILGNVGGAGNHIRWLCLLDKNFHLKDIIEKNKFNFILNNVYGKDRTWHNWLKIEWSHRKIIDDIIYFSHFFYEIKRRVYINKVLHINVNGENCYKHYVKFNSNLNNIDKKYFVKKTDSDNNIYKKLSDKKTNQNFGNNFTFLSVNFDHFYKNPLDNKIINEINNFFSINIPVDQAKELHNEWISLNKKAEIEIITDLRKLYE